MAEGAVLKMLLETVNKLIMDEADLLLGVKGHIYKLQNELEWMNISIRNAEADETLCLRSDEKLKLWVKQVRGIIFDTKDVIDEFIQEIVHCKQFQIDPEALKDGLKGHISSAKQLPSLHKYGNRIKKINTRLNDLQANRERYWFVSAQATGGGTGSSSYQGSSLSLQQKIERRRAEIAVEECHSAIIIHEESMRQVKSLLLTGDAKNEKLRIKSRVSG
ncbi:hypothetical protein MKW92_000914 [Papaver armeniacum]|nr:hypothetical protein MKW92_000914 [Papaver armeniacum]